MRRLPPVCILLMAGVVFAGFVGGCKPRQESGQVLKVGVLASLSGHSSRWGRTTIECAQATADYWNEKGGFEIAGKRYRIKLVHADYSSDAQHAMRMVSELIHEHDVRYLIGPLTDAAAVAVAPMLDAAGVAFIHYGFDSSLVREDSLGLLGMPIPLQTLPVIYEYLSQNKQVGSVCVLAKDSVQAMSQKLLAERIAQTVGIEPLRYSSFDVSEENFDSQLPGEQIAVRLQGLQRVNPDAVLLCGMGPEEVPQALFHLRQTGFSGPVVSLNSQEPDLLRGIGSLADGLIFVGGHMSSEHRSDYYKDLRRRVVAELGEWQFEADLKLYSLDVLLRLIRAGGDAAIENPAALYSVLNASLEYPDPFFETSQTLRFVGEGVFSADRQISLPILISEVAKGNLTTVYRSELQY